MNCERVLASHQHDKWLASGSMDAQPHIVGGIEQKAEMRRIVEDHAVRRVGFGGHQLNCRILIFFADIHQGGKKRRGHQALGRHDTDRLGAHIAKRRQAAQQYVMLGHPMIIIFAQHQSGFGKDHLVRTRLDKRDRKRPFEQFYLAADCRRCNAQIIGGGSHRTVLGREREIMQAVVLHINLIGSTYAGH